VTEAVAGDPGAGATIKTVTEATDREAVADSRGAGTGTDTGGTVGEDGRKEGPAEGGRGEGGAQGPRPDPGLKMTREISRCPMTPPTHSTVRDSM